MSEWTGWAGLAGSPATDRKRCTKKQSWCSSYVPLAANGTGIFLIQPFRPRGGCDNGGGSYRIAD